MRLEKGLVKVEKSSHYVRYLLIIGVLVISFSLAFTMRMQPLEYGFELNEFDPFFNYRATQFMVENGLPAYLEWNDDLSWYPHGRDVSNTSQVSLHATTATLYQIFGMGTNLYDFTILFPVVIGSLATVVIFGIVRIIGGTTAGLFASLFFAVSPIIIIRGSIGWFKSEPLGLFYGLLAVYLLLSGIKSDKGKVSVAKIVGGGILLALGIGSWGGIQFFILPIGLFFVALPFLRKDSKFIIWASVLFVSVFILVTVAVAITSEPLQTYTYGVIMHVINSMSNLLLVGCTAFLVACVMIRKILKKAQLRGGLVLLGSAVVAGIAIISSGMISLPSFRYLNAANPYMITTDLLTDSVSEHATTTIDISFFFFSVLMIFAGIGAWLLFQKRINRSLQIKGEMAAFALIIGFLGIYFSSAFVRLEVFGSISVIILSSIGISILISKILKEKHKPTSVVTKISFLAIIVALLMVPMTYPEINWANNNKGLPVTILNSGTQFNVSTNDWSDAMQWLRENTPEDAVIASWWDYGYWISTLGERKTLADNSTLLDWQIRKIAATYMSTPEDAWQILMSDIETNVGSHYVTLPTDITNPTRPTDDVHDENQAKLDDFKDWREDVVVNPDPLSVVIKGSSVYDTAVLYTGDYGSAHLMYDGDKAKEYPTLFDYWEQEMYVPPPILTGLDADYIIINLAVEKLSEENDIDLYTLRQKGGDETKAYWFMKITDLDLFDYYNPELSGYTDKFWNETLLGNMIPYTPITYVDADNPEIQSETFKPGYIPIYLKDIKFPNNEDGPFQLVYVPPSFERDAPGPLTGPLIYKINKEYNPNQ